MIDKPGIYDISEREYHAGPTPGPELSSSIIRILWQQSPLHAKAAHPKLSPVDLIDTDPTRPKEIGTAAHKLILGRGRELVHVAGDNWRSGAAREMRQNAYLAGRSPILSADFATAQDIATAAREQLAGTELEGIFDRPGQAEATAISPIDTGLQQPVWRKARLDWLPEGDGHLTLVDVKTVSTSAHPLDWANSMIENGGDIQAAWYRRLVVDIRHPKSLRLLFLVVEQNPPYAVSINEPSGEAIEAAEQVIGAATALWAQCLRTGEFPGYDKGTNSIDPPVWARYKHEARILGYQHLLETMAQWQAPHAPGKEENER